MRLISGGFEWVIEGHGRGAIMWKDVSSVECFKRDLLTTDVVCMNIKLASGEYFLLSEEVSGFVSLIKALNETWSLGDDWYRKVVLPPFKTCKVTITPPSEATQQRGVLKWEK